MAKRRNTIVRGKPKYQPQPTLLVICEDSKSGKNYLQDANQYFRSNIYIEVCHSGHTDPNGIVSEAIKRAKGFDRVVCAIDRDAHPKFEEALHLARKSDKVELCVSYPCFEFWLLLHFEYTRKPYVAAGGKSAADRLISDLGAFPGMDGYDKGRAKGVFAQLLGQQFDAARERGPRVLKDAVETGEMNPSTKVFELMRVMEEMGMPRVLEG